MTEKKSLGEPLWQKGSFFVCVTERVIMLTKNEYSIQSGKTEKPTFEPLLI